MSVEVQLQGHRTSQVSWRIATGLRNPRLAWAYLNRKRRIARITGCSFGQVKSYYDELSSDYIFLDQIRTGLSEFHDLGLGFAGCSPELYVISRIAKPATIIETGVANGVSSAFMLRALERNHSGTLISVSLDKSGDKLVPYGKDVGWLVPDRLRARWQLRLGKSSELLPSITDGVKPLDIFFHDSDHSHENMMFEFETTWPRIKPGGYLLADDAWLNDSFPEFCRNHELSPNYIRNSGMVKKHS